MPGAIKSEGHPEIPMPESSVGRRLATWIDEETRYYQMASSGSSCAEIRCLVFQRLGEAIERNGAAHSAVMGILEGLESQQQHRRGSVPS